MSRNTVTAEGLAITYRFFHTLDVLRQKRVIRGLQTFTKAHNINYWNLSSLKKEPEAHLLKPEFLAYLVEDYNVSAEYLLTGVGNMFKE